MILTAAALAMLQLAQAPAPHDPEIEALMRRRDERRRAEAMQRAEAPPPADDRATLAGQLPPAVAERLGACLASANADPQAGIADAQAWVGQGGGIHAAQCEGYALGKAARWREAADAFERAAATKDIDPVARARLWSQGGNAALLAGDPARALRALDNALAGPLPATLSTGEIHLDRARARVATGDAKGARGDLDKALVLAAADPLAWLLSATLARRMDDLPLARAHIEEAARRAPDDASIALEQGVIHALSGDRDAAARAAFSRARELAGEKSEIGRQAADYLGQLGK